MKVHIITKCHVIEIPYFFYRAYLKARGLCFNSTRTFRLFFFKRDMFTRQVGLSWGKLANCEVLQESLGQTAA